MNDFLAKYQKEQEKKKDEFKKKIATWCEFLEKNGILQATCDYDGSGDSGEIDGVCFFKQYNDPRIPHLAASDSESFLSEEELNKLKLPDELKQKTWIFQEGRQPRSEIPAGDQKVMDAYEVWASEALPDGFEINDGSFGTLDLNVKDKCMEVTNNARMTHYETETYEFSKVEDIDGTPPTSCDE